MIGHTRGSPLSGSMRPRSSSIRVSPNIDMNSRVEHDCLFDGSRELPIKHTTKGATQHTLLKSRIMEYLRNGIKNSKS